MAPVKIVSVALVLAVASWNGGPPAEIRSNPEALTQHLSSRCISSISVRNGA